MVELIFIVFEEPEEGYSAVEGKYSLMVVAKDWEQLKQGIKNAILEHFNGLFNGKVVLRQFQDQELDMD